MEDRHVTRASHPLKIGDKTFNARAHTDGDIEDLNEWMRSQFISVSRKSLKGMTLSQYEQEMGIIYTRAAELDWRSGRGAKMMSSLSGFSRVVWAMIKDDHPEYDHAQVYELIKANPDSIEDCVNVFKRVNRVKTGEGQPHPEL